MKITIDDKTNEIKFGGKDISELDESKKNKVTNLIRSAVLKHTMLSDYEEDSVWMSYRYCIGRHTIASHMRAGDIWTNCKGRMKRDRQLFTAFDINREIEDKLRCGYGGPEWHFPITSLNRIYTPAIDIFCEFLEDYNIKSKEDYLKYYCIDVMLTDNERGYKIETTTWEEKLTSLIPVFKEVYDLENVDDIIKLIKVLQKKKYR